MHLRDIGSLILLASLLGLQLQLGLAKQTSLNPAPDKSDEPDEFFHADEDFGDQDGYEEDELFYDVEEELSNDENAAENTCATSNKEVCKRCCHNQGFDMPFWNTATGHCQCFVSYGEENICKEASQSSKACKDCCLKRGFLQSDFPVSRYGQRCYCSAPDYQLFESSFKPSLRRVPS